MGMCCEKMMMIGWRNAWSMKLRVQGQEEDQREVVREDCQARKLNKEDAMDRCKWRKAIKDVQWSGWVWVSECFFWYWPTRVVPGKRPLNGCVCLLRHSGMAGANERSHVFFLSNTHFIYKCSKLYLSSLHSDRALPHTFASTHFSSH